MITGELVGLLTEAQKNSLVGVQYLPDCYYHPIQDADANWIISIEEINGTTDPNFLWIKDIPLIPYNPIIPPVTGTTI